VLLVNVSRYRSDTLVVTADAPPVVVRLPDAGEVALVDRSNAYVQALQDQDAASRGRDLVALAGAQERLLQMLDWLWGAVARPSLDALPADAVPGPDGPPRVWWCPTGPLTVFPLHAAGSMSDPGSAPATDPRSAPGSDPGSGTVLDRVVSSYTPTLRALLDARRRPPAGDPRFLLVGVPDAPGQARLASVDRELDRIHTLYPGRCDVLRRQDATRAQVLAALPQHQGVHFSCHGTQDLARPSRGGLLLQDGLLTACQTAIGGVALLDESIHLAAALQMIGFRHVVATLWSVYDRIAGDVTDLLYSGLASTDPTSTDPTSTGPAPTRRARDGAGPDVASTARCLHRALVRIRDAHPGHPTAWAPFIHLGP